MNGRTVRTSTGNPTSHFGRQLRKERLSQGWSLDELARQTGVNAAHLSRIENGKRPPTGNVADACDSVFPDRRGWFREYYEESKSWTPPWFRSWPEYEDKAAALHVWSPGIIHGLLQTSDYARALLATLPGVADEMVASRLASRMERQQRVLARESPPAAWFVIDELSLYRKVGSAAVMAGQMAGLLAVAAAPRLTVQVLPAVAHPATAGELIIADDAAWCEHHTAGYVFSGEETVSSLRMLFDSLRAESYRASESVALIERMGEIWTAGGNPLTAAPTGGHA